MPIHLRRIVVGAGLIALGAVSVPTAVNASVNYFDATRTVSGTGTASCSHGWKVTGGGAETLPPDSFGSTTSYEYKLTGSYPASTTTWKATAT